MDIIEDLTARIEEYRATNKQPCKSYVSRAGAVAAGARVAQMAADHFAIDRTKPARPARYVVFQVPAWGRWVACIDLTEVMQRPSSTGGYLGICRGFFTY